MTRKLLFVILSLALLTGSVGLGIHLLHKDALANITYSVDPIWMVDNQVTFFWEWGHVYMRFFKNEQWSTRHVANDEGDGVYSYTCAIACEEWQVWVMDSRFDPDTPPTNPCTVDGDVISFDWQGWWNPFL